MGDKSQLNLVLVYRPHNLYNNEPVTVNNPKLCDILSSSPKPSVIFGDFNFSDINWDLMSSAAHSAQFLKTVQDCFLTKHIDFPTHISGTRPDLVLSTDPNLVLGVEDVGS